MSSVYRPLFRRAWTISWQARSLWLFGFFTAILVGGGGVNVLFRNFERLGAIGAWATAVRDGGRFVAIPWGTLAGLSPGFWLVAGLVLLLTVFLVWFSLVAQGALIRGTERERKRDHVSLQEGIAYGRSCFPRLLFVTLAFHIISQVAWFLVSLPPFLLYLATGHSFWYTAFIVIAFVCLVPLTFVLLIVYRMASVAVVVEGMQALRAITFAWQLLASHWLVLLEVEILLTIVISLVAIVAVSLVMMGVVILFGPLVLFGYFYEIPLLLTTSLGVSVAAFFIALAGLGAILALFQQAVWTLLFIRLRESPPYAKLVRVAAAVSFCFKHRVA